MKKIISENECTRNILSTIRGIQESYNHPEKTLLKEEDEKDNKKSIAITDDPKFGQQVLTSQIKSFRSSVDGGAQFTEANKDDVASSPLIFLPKEKNMIFSGTIPAMSNLKFQFVLKTNTGYGCFVWADNLILTKENMATLNKLFGYYENWKASWNAASGDLDTLANYYNEK